ncbi:hypothetical protein MTO96_035631 [Rhipicephalus appendiculatus]
MSRFSSISRESTAVSLSYILILLAACRCEDHWTYGRGVAQWPYLQLDGENQCGGKYQSPINIASKAAAYVSNLGLVHYNGHLDQLQNVSVVNNGHTAELAKQPGAEWHRDKALRYMREKSVTKVGLTFIPPLRDLMPKKLEPYFRYQGSLTTPPCSEAVTWTVLWDSGWISEAQLQAFRDLKVHHGNESSSEHLVNNFRPVTPLNGRIVYRNFLYKKTGSPFLV